MKNSHKGVVCVPILWLSHDLLMLVSGNDFTTYVLLGLVYRKTSAQCSAVETELRSSLVSPYSDMIEKLDCFLSPCCFREAMYPRSKEDAIIYEPVHKVPRPHPKAPVPPQTTHFTAFTDEGKPRKRKLSCLKQDRLMPIGDESGSEDESQPKRPRFYSPNHVSQAELTSILK